jgi:hypothetical protein
MNKKKEGVLFSIVDNQGNVIHNIFIEIVNFAQPKEKHKDLIFKMNKLLKNIFSGENIELLSIFDLDHLKGKFAYPKAHDFPIELFYNSKCEFNEHLFKKIILSLKQGEREHLPSLTTGAVTRGRDFFNQEKFISEIWESLKNKHIILTGPRRVGKTSILYHLLDSKKNGFTPLHIDLEGISDVPSFATEVIMAYNRWIMRAFEGKTEQEVNVEKKRLKTSLEIHWQERWEEFCLSLNHKVLFLFDEFTMMLENMLSKNKEEACQLLDILYQTIPKLRETRCIITGSILIKRVIDMLDYGNKDAFYSLFDEKRLFALSKEDGYELTQILLAGIGIMPEKEKVETILSLIGSPIPFFIQLFVLEIEKGLLREDKATTPENIKGVYQERLLGSECKSYFRHYYDHLSKYRLGFIYPMPGLKDIFEELSKAERTAVELKPIFKQRCPRVSDDDFARLMEYLEDEFYIEEVEGRYAFSCNLIRDWWLRHSRYLNTEETYGEGTF